MANIFHLSAIIIGFVAYFFSDVNSNSGFTNTFLPLLVLFSFMYGIVVTINLLYKSRNKSKTENKSADILLATIKQQGIPAAVSIPKQNVVVPLTAPVEGKAQFKTAVEPAPSITPITVKRSRPTSRVAQAEINQTEWDNPENWSGPTLIAVYFSKRDSRTWVSKQIPMLGWTLNLAKSGSVVWRYILWLAALACTVFVLVYL